MTTSMTTPRRILRWGTWIAGSAVVVVAFLGGRFVASAAPSGLGLAAKQLCSLVYVSGLDPSEAQKLYVDPAIAPLDLVMSVDYDDERRTVTTRGLWLWSATALMRDGVGCTLTSSREPDVTRIPLPPVAEIPLPIDPGSSDVAFDTGAIETALDAAFDPSHDTLAIVVLHDGRLVAERYAPGISPNTPLPGWSMGKSLTATLVGLLVERGFIDPYEVGVIEEWAGDAGSTVTIDHLLRMTSGLDVVEDQSGTDPASKMLFVEPDAAAFATARGVATEPGSRWEYTSGNTVLLAREVVEATGGTLESGQGFMREALLRPLGAPTFVFEPDAAGTFIGSSFVLASAHDWAKLGQLLLDDGVRDGERILPEGWIEYVTTPTPESGSASYGAGFWLVEPTDGTGLPQDAYYANGFQGQYLFVIPSRSLVVVRLGASHGPTGTFDFVEALVDAMR